MRYWLRFTYCIGQAKLINQGSSMKKIKCPRGHAANGLGSNLVTDVAAMKTPNDNNACAKCALW